MVKFNPAIYKDVTELKRLRKLKDESKYISLQKKIAAKYHVTIRTVQNWLNKRKPGLRDKRDDAGKLRKPVMPKEKKIVAELIASGTQIKEVKKIVEKRTGRKLTNRKLDNIRKKAESMVEELPGQEVKPSEFGDQAKQLFSKLFELDLIAPGYGVKIKVNGRSFTIPKEDVEDICLILANAYNRTAVNLLKVDREQLLRQRLFHLVEAQVRLASVNGIDTKEVTAIINQFTKLQQDIELDANIRTVEKICKELKPDITWSEIGALIKKYTDDID